MNTPVTMQVGLLKLPGALCRYKVADTTTVSLIAFMAGTLNIANVRLKGLNCRSLVSYHDQMDLGSFRKKALNKNLRVEMSRGSCRKKGYCISCNISGQETKRPPITGTDDYDIYFFL